MRDGSQGDSWEKVSVAFGTYSDLFLMVAGSPSRSAVLFRGCGRGESRRVHIERSLRLEQDGKGGEKESEFLL